MADTSTTQEALTLAQRLVNYGLEIAPRVLTVFVVFILGLLSAFALRAAVRWAMERFGIEALAERAGISRLLYAVGIKKGSAHVAGQITFYAVLLLTFHSVTELTGLPGISDLLAVMVSHLPRALAALGILIGGLLGADILARIVKGLAERNDSIDSPHFVSRFIYYGAVVLSVTLAAEHLGFEVDLINALIQIVVAAACFGVALALALGSTETFRNLIARFYVARLYRTGDRIDIEGVSGVIIAFSPTGLLVQEGAEEHAIPYNHFMTGTVRLQRVTPSDKENTTEPL